MINKLKRLTLNDNLLVLAIVFLLLTSGMYFFFFYVSKEYPLSADPNLWGTFGDYFGGVLNPLFSIVMILYVRKGIMRQQKEFRKLMEEQKKSNDTSTEALNDTKKEIRVSRILSAIEIAQNELNFYYVRVTYPEFDCEAFDLIFREAHKLYLEYYSETNSKKHEEAFYSIWKFRLKKVKSLGKLVGQQYSTRRSIIELLDDFMPDRKLDL